MCRYFTIVLERSLRFVTEIKIESSEALPQEVIRIVLIAVMRPTKSMRQDDQRNRNSGFRKLQDIVNLSHAAGNQDLIHVALRNHCGRRQHKQYRQNQHQLLHTFLPASSFLPGSTSCYATRG